MKKAEEKQKQKVGDYYAKKDKFIAVADGGRKHKFSTLHNAMLYSRIIRSGKIGSGRLTYDVDYKTSIKNRAEVV